MKNNTEFEYVVTDRSGNHRFRIVADLNYHLRILDKAKGKTFIIDPIHIVLNKEHSKYSPDDILRIGFIFGQQSVAGPN